MDRDSSEPPLVHFCFEGHDYGMVTVSYARAVVQRHEQERRSSAPSPPSSSSSRLRRRPGYATYGTGTRVRQSAMYSDRPRRFRDNRGQAQPPTDSSAAVHAGDMGSGLTDPTIMMPSAAEEALSPRSKFQRKIEGLPTFDTIDDAFEYLCNSEMCAQASAKGVSLQSLLDEFEAQSVLDEEQARSVPAPEQARPIPAHEKAQPIQGRYCEASNEEIAQNGKKWMCEEVMVAFRKYIEKHDDLKELEYEFDELHHQCFNVENYHKIFHHFNFTVKMKAPSSTDWTSMLCFAEVKEILTQKIYFCSPLEPHENGHCSACKNQGMDELKHPLIGAFDRGSVDAEFPFKPEECNYLLYEVDPFD